MQMARLLGCLFWASLLLFVLSWWQFDDFVEDLQPGAERATEPMQKATQLAPFDTEQGGVRYRVKPRYDYELSGLVVSRKHHDGEFSLHRLWNDNLNVADLCVVWGSNATALDLSAFSFWSAEFTCYFRTQSRAAWAAFVPGQMSNNHLLADKADLRDEIMKAQIGDQIHLKGVLAEYRNDSGFYRGTSTVRTDRGNGACETVYVQSFAITRSMPSIWRALFDPAWVVALFSGLWWVIGVARGKY